jgi:hypothetical protein
MFYTVFRFLFNPVVVISIMLLWIAYSLTTVLTF